MRCPKCGAAGYNRKTRTPEWRCRKCGHEWDVAPAGIATSGLPQSVPIIFDIFKYVTTLKVFFIFAVVTMTFFFYGADRDDHIGFFVLRFLLGLPFAYYVGKRIANRWRKLLTSWGNRVFVKGYPDQQIYPDQD
jgi:rubredoxin